MLKMRIEQLNDYRSPNISLGFTGLGNIRRKVAGRIKYHKVDP